MEEDGNCIIKQNLIQRSNRNCLLPIFVNNWPLFNFITKENQKRFFLLSQVVLISRNKLQNYVRNYS